MTTFRRFRNTDPPALADVWNESLTSRGSFPLSTPALFERWVLSKPYFDPNGLILATEDVGGRVLGFALVGFTALAAITLIVSALLLLTGQPKATLVASRTPPLHSQPAAPCAPQSPDTTAPG